MNIRLLSAFSSVAAIALTGCLSSGGDVPFPTINKAGSTTSAGFVIAPSAPAGRMDITTANALTGGAGGVTMVNELADPENGGPSTVTSVINTVPGFSTLGFVSGSAFEPYRLPENPSTLAASLLSDCVQMIGGTTDADGDSIPKSQGYIFNCHVNQGTGPDGIFGFTGRLSYTDANDAVAFPGAGYSFVYDNLHYRSHYNGYTFDNVFSGTFDFWNEGITRRMEVAFESTLETDNPTSQNETGTTGYYMDWSMTPSNNATPYMGGRISFSGFYRNDQLDGLVLEFSTNNLTYGSACTGFYNSGTITYVDGANNKIVYTFDNCNMVVTFNGTVI